jgi:hypothetical protein
VDDAFSQVLVFVLTDNIEGTSGDEHIMEHLRQIPSMALRVRN